MDNHQRDEILIDIQEKLGRVVQITEDNQNDLRGPEGLVKRVQIMETSRACYVKFVRGSFALACAAGGGIGWLIAYLTKG